MEGQAVTIYFLLPKYSFFDDFQAICHASLLAQPEWKRPCITCNQHVRASNPHGTIKEYSMGQLTDPPTNALKITAL
jgi:hypothetical protein